MTHRVEINDCLTQFHRAHIALIESLGGAQNIADSSRRQHGPRALQILEHNWQKLYHATPVRSNSSWKYLDFESEQHYTLFILKWS